MYIQHAVIHRSSIQNGQRDSVSSLFHNISLHIEAEIEPIIPCLNLKTWHYGLNVCIPHVFKISCVRNSISKIPESRKPTNLSCPPSHPQFGTAEVSLLISAGRVSQEGTEEDAPPAHGISPVSTGPSQPFKAVRVE